MNTTLTDSNNDNWDVTYISEENSVKEFKCVRGEDIMTLYLNQDGSMYGVEYYFIQLSHDENLKQLNTQIFNWYSSL